MEKIEFGEIIELEDGKEFICFARVEEAGEEYVITYITHSWGGAAQYAKKALRLKKTVIPLCDAL